MNLVCSCQPVKCLQVNNGFTVPGLDQPFDDEPYYNDMTFEPCVFNGGQGQNMMMGNKSNGFGAGLHRTANASHFQQFSMIDPSANDASSSSSSALKGMTGRMFSSAIDTPSVPVNRSMPFAGTQKRPAHLRMNND